jgi:hypothetical protein
MKKKRVFNLWSRYSHQLDRIENCIFVLFFHLPLPAFLPSETGGHYGQPNFRKKPEARTTLRANGGEACSSQVKNPLQFHFKPAYKALIFAKKGGGLPQK